VPELAFCEAGTPTQHRGHSLVRQCWAELGRKNRTFLSPDRGRTSINCTQCPISSEPFLPRRIMHWRSDTITFLPLRVPWFWFPHFFPLYSVDGAEGRRGVYFIQRGSVIVNRQTLRDIHRFHVDAIFIEQRKRATDPREHLHVRGSRLSVWTVRIAWSLIHDKYSQALTALLPYNVHHDTLITSTLFIYRVRFS